MQTSVIHTSHTTHTLEVDGVHLSFDNRPVLQSVYLKVTSGRVTGLLGRNGSGKSCLMRIMHGSLDVADSSVRIDGRWVRRAYRHGVMYAPQHGFIPGGRTVRNALRDFGLGVERLIELFPAMGSLVSSPLVALSGGERRIVEVFIVLASPLSRFCLLDEPFSQVSPLHASVLKSLIGEMAREGKGILVSDHLWRDIFEISDTRYLIAARATHPVDSPADLQKFGYVK